MNAYHPSPQEHARQAKEAGMTDYMVKPYDRAHLMDRIQRLAHF